MIPIRMPRWTDRRRKDVLRVNRETAWMEQGGICFYCLLPVEREEATTEHRDPKANGGTDHFQNIAAACLPCNWAKGPLSETEFRAILEGEAEAATPEQADARRRYRLGTAADSACRRILALVGQ